MTKWLNAECLCCAVCVSSFLSLSMVFDLLIVCVRKEGNKSDLWKLLFRFRLWQTWLVINKTMTPRFRYINDFDEMGLALCRCILYYRLTHGVTRVLRIVYWFFFLLFSSLHLIFILDFVAKTHQQHPWILWYSLSECTTHNKYWVLYPRLPNSVPTYRIEVSVFFFLAPDRLVYVNGGLSKRKTRKKTYINLHGF